MKEEKFIYRRFESNERISFSACNTIQVFVIREF